jgi:predicted TIM-barrel fold metal-dependent hydrolase
MWWAHLPMHRPEEAAKELERAVGMGAVGFNTGGANLGGLDLHSPQMDVLWEKAAELDVPVFIHGHPQVLEWAGGEDQDVFDTTIALGYMYDESRAFWHLICGGVLDRFPTLKFYITHAGGMTPYQYERFGELHKTLAPDSVNERPVVEYMSSFYFDPMIPSPVMRRAIVDIIGLDHLVYGTNLMGSDQIEVDLTDGIGLSEGDRERIRSGNAIKLLKLEDRVSA